MLKKRNNRRSILILSMITVFSMSGSAHAYLDPGTGSMLLQLILGGVAGLMVIGKLYWHNFKSYLGFKPADTSTDGN